MRTLNNLSDLKKSKYGQPPPRHGLILLWWFVHECVDIDSNGRMVALCNPNNGDFGFHRFYNREKLLPYSKLPYYDVGNLHKTGSLPKYVTENYTGNLDDSNKDRIIVLFNSKGHKFDSIYVTQHISLLNFDQNHTYCISIELMKDIKGLSREEFLNGPARTNQPNPPHVSIFMPSTYNPSVPARVSYTPQPHTPQPYTPQPYTPQPYTPQPRTPQPVQSESCLSKKCCCVVFCVLMLPLLIIAIVLLYKF